MKHNAGATPAIEKAVAIANNEVAILGWTVNVFNFEDLLGFHIVRQVLDAGNHVVEERPMATWVAFAGQSNPDWQPQNTSVWPVQKFTWRDLTLRQRRDALERRPDGQRLRYSIAPVGKPAPGRKPVKVIETPGSSYTGEPVELAYVGKRALTNVVTATIHRPPFTSTFTNGILSTQFLLRTLAKPDAHGAFKFPPGVVERRLSTPGDALRTYLTGDVLPLIHEFFAQPGGRFLAALYEFEDEELETLVTDNAARIDLILSDAGGPDSADNYDTRNSPTRERLRKIARKHGSTFKLTDRLFNGSGHIGHNKFVVHVDDNGDADSVITGSTNWTWSGVAGQSNNCIRIDDAEIATAFRDYWHQLFKDKIPTPKPTSAKALTGTVQSQAFKESNLVPVGGTIANDAKQTFQIWFSPNVPGHAQPAKAMPPDIAELFSIIEGAEHAIFFLVFLPSVGGINSVISKAVEWGEAHPDINVIGAISDSKAMWTEPKKAAGLKATKASKTAPHLFQSNAISVIRATALTDKEIGRPIGDFKFDERLAAEHAIIHDKILVVDPLDPDRCVVAFGSHNLGYKASYSNDENLTIVRGHRPLAEAYTAHVLDVYDHYRFRAASAEPPVAAAPGTPARKPWDGFLATDPKWQSHSARRLARYLVSRKPDPKV